MDAQLSSSIRSLVSDVAANESEILTLRTENASLKDRLQVIKAENSALHADIDGKNKDLQTLLIELDHLHKQRLDYVDGVRQHFSVQADVVDMKYEMEILNSKIRNLDRELVVQKSENERLRRINQNLYSDRTRK